MDDRNRFSDELTRDEVTTLVDNAKSKSHLAERFYFVLSAECFTRDGCISNAN